MGPVMIVPRLDKVLAKEERTFYWLAKETNVSHTAKDVGAPIPITASEHDAFSSFNAGEGP